MPSRIGMHGGGNARGGSPGRLSLRCFMSARQWDCGLRASVGHNWRWLREGQQVDATVVDSTDDDWYTVEYHGTVIAEGDMWGGDWKMGDRIRVIVHPDDRSRVRNISSLWLELLLGVPITAAVIVGAPPVVYWLIGKRRPKEPPA
jgi:hypothetical protein